MPWLLAPEFTVVAESPDHHRHYTGSPCLIADGPGCLLCSWEWFQPPPVTETIPNQLHIAASEDEGRTWSVLSRQDMTWPSLFKAGDALYLLGSRRMTREIVIQRSVDGGTSWTPESVLFEGRYHGAATNILLHNGHVFRAYETCPLNQPGGRGRSDWHSLVVAGNTGADLLSPASWRMSNRLPFPGVPDVLHGQHREPDYPRRVMEDCWIEGNIVRVDGELRNILRTCFDGYSTGSIAAVNRVHDTDIGLVCEFMQYSAMPGAQCKFQIVHDVPSNLFWTAANLQTCSWQDWNVFQARTQAAGRPAWQRASHSGVAVQPGCRQLAAGRGSGHESQAVGSVQLCLHPPARVGSADSIAHVPGRHQPTRHQSGDPAPGTAFSGAGPGPRLGPYINPYCHKE